MAKLQALAATAGFNAGKNFYATTLPVNGITINPEIAQLFTKKEKIVAEIAQSMKDKGYDKSQPIVVTKRGHILVDGHTRLAAAKAAGLEEIPVYEAEFDNVDDAILYTFERQVMRRNLTGAEILQASQMLKRKTNDGKVRAAEQLAERLGVSAAIIYQARKVAAEASEQDLEAIRNNEKTINGLYNEITKRPPRQKKPTGVAASNNAASSPEDSAFPDNVQEPREQAVTFTVSDVQELPANVMFLKSVVSLLISAEQQIAAQLLVNHYLEKNEREGFYKLLDEPICEKLLSQSESAS
jgi:ParB family chromosome partitioning protein